MVKLYVISYLYGRNGGTRDRILREYFIIFSILKEPGVFAYYIWLRVLNQTISEMLFAADRLDIDCFSPFTEVIFSPYWS